MAKENIPKKRYIFEITPAAIHVTVSAMSVEHAWQLAAKHEEVKANTSIIKRIA